MKVFLSVVAGVFCLTVSAARAETNTKPALAAITDAADRVCNIVPVGGERQAVQIEAAVKAEVNGLLKKLTDLAHLIHRVSGS